MKYSFQCCTYLIIAAFFLGGCKSKQTGTVNPAAPDSLRVSNNNPYENVDQSPMDMIWYPINYPIEKMKGAAPQTLIARVIYSRPHKKNRVIFGDTETALCMYGRPWRLGANEATEVDFFENVSIAGTNIPKGTYVIYCIPHPDRWTIILNKNLYTWGLHIKESDDLFRTDVPTAVQSPALEDFTMVFQDNAAGADLLMSWDNVKAVLPVTFAK